MRSRRQTVDNASVNFVLKHDAVADGVRLEALERAVRSWRRKR